HLEGTLHGRLRLQRMQVADAGQPRHLLVEAGIVLHGARAQRIDAHVDGVVLLAEPGVVLHHLRLAEARQTDLAGAAQSVETVFHFRRFRQVDGAAAGLAHLEDQRLLDLQRLVAGERAHHSTSFRPATSNAMPASVAVSVAASNRRLATDGSLGMSRDTGTPARMRLFASASTTGAAGLGRRTANSLKKLSFSTVTPGTAATRSASCAALAWLSSASRRKPASPSRVRWTVKASAHRPALVQMLEVAFSRRICCSRVLSVSTKPRLPSASTVSPTSRPGIWRTYLSRVANRPTYGPPKPNPLPIDWPSQTTMSAPISPGGLIRPSDTTSVTTTINSAPAAWQAAA